MAIGKKLPPRLHGSMDINSLANELNRIFTEIYEDINVIENKLSVYLNMVQDSQSGTLGSLRLTKKATSDKNDDGSPVIPGLFKMGGRWLVSKKTLKKFLEGNE